MPTETIQNHLLSLSDPTYRAFSASLMPTVDPETVIGVRTPLLRAYAKQLFRDGLCLPFLTELPHRYFEENQLHAFLIEQIRDFDGALDALGRFLPYVDNWATCDQLSPRAFAKAPERLLPHIRSWLASEKPYTVRFGIGMLMRYFLDERFDPSYLAEVAAIRSDDYYVCMMVAWYFATALAKQYADAVVYLEQNRLPPVTHNKVIAKAVESYRVPDNAKAYLRTLKRKERDA